MLAQHVAAMWLLWTSILGALHQSECFTQQSSINRAPWTTKNLIRQSTELSMVFDFFKERSQEGLDQLSNLADAAKRGKLGEGLADVAAYTRETNTAFASGLARSRAELLNNLEALFTGVSGEEILEQLEDTLLQADLGVSSAEEIVNEVRSLRQDSTKPLSRDDLLSILRGKLVESLQTEESAAIKFSTNEQPTVLFIMGANGMGKTTTIGKIAHRLRTEGNQTVLMAACDTYRAGAVDQLQQWADRAEVDLYGPSENVKTPAAVLYGALDKAVQEDYDTLLVDTSGRLSNNDQLTAELEKMKKVIQKRLSVEKDKNDNPVLNTAVPHETLLVLDAAQGRMALDSAKVWNKEIGLSGLILTKLDGTARGGSVVAVSKELGLPVKLIGVGEGINDLRDFEPERFVDGLLGIGAAGGGSKSDEGALLSKRLETMRKERDERAKTKKPEPVAVGAGGPQFTGDPLANGLPNQNRRRKPNRKKKKKKGGR